MRFTIFSTSIIAIAVAIPAPMAINNKVEVSVPDQAFSNRVTLVTRQDRCDVVSCLITLNDATSPEEELTIRRSMTGILHRPLQCLRYVLPVFVKRRLVSISGLGSGWLYTFLTYTTFSASTLRPARLAKAAS